MATLKYSRQREIIYRHLLSRDDHPTAEMIYTSLKDHDPKLSLGTVYRNLGLLVELGRIGRLCTDDGPDRYDGKSERHGHFICSRCGSIQDFIPEGLDEQISRMMNREGFSVETVEITVRGSCRACQAKNGAASAADIASHN